MKRVIFSGFIAMMLVSCGGASEEQTNAAKQMCKCMDEAAMGDFEIDYFECELQVLEKYPGDILTDDGWKDALNAECPTVAAKITEND